MLFFDIIKSIYKKLQLPEEIDRVTIIALFKYLSYDKDNLFTLKKLYKYLFYVDPKYFLYLLWIHIPKKDTVPFLKKIEKQREKEIDLFFRMKELLEWGNNDLYYNKPVLNQVILKNDKYWKSQLGID